MSIDWPQALAWRMRQQLLEPIGTESVEGVVRRLVAIPAQADASAELAVRTRRQRSEPGEVARALADGRLIKTFAFRGATQLMTPEEGGVYLALRAASRQWELPSWQSFYRLTPTDWPIFRQAVREALGDGPLTIDELGRAIIARPRFRHLSFAFPDNAWTLLKYHCCRVQLPARGFRRRPVVRQLSHRFRLNRMRRFLRHAIEDIYGLVDSIPVMSLSAQSGNY